MHAVLNSDKTNIHWGREIVSASIYVKEEDNDFQSIIKVTVSRISIDYVDPVRKIKEYVYSSGIIQNYRWRFEFLAGEMSIPDTTNNLLSQVTT